MEFTDPGFFYFLIKKEIIFIFSYIHRLDAQTAKEIHKLVKILTIRYPSLSTFIGIHYR